MSLDALLENVPVRFTMSPVATASPFPPPPRGKRADGDASHNTSYASGVATGVPATDDVTAASHVPPICTMYVALS